MIAEFVNIKAILAEVEKGFQAYVLEHDRLLDNYNKLLSLKMSADDSILKLEAENKKLKEDIAKAESECKIISKELQTLKDKVSIESK